jgi:hypothetical protein
MEALAFMGLSGFATDSRLKAKDFFDFTTERGPATFPLVRIDRNPDGTTKETPVMLDGKPLAPPNPVGGENPFTRSQAGFVFGGPIRREGTFFFTSFERQDIHASQESHFAVPTVRQRGVFETGDTGFNSDGIPLTPASLPGNAIFSLFPFPNNPFGPYGPNTYTAVLPADAEGTLFSIKLDQHFSAFGAQHTLTGRYNFTDDTSILPVTGGAIFSSLRPRVRTQNMAFFFNRCSDKVYYLMAYYLSHEELQIKTQPIQESRPIQPSADQGLVRFSLPGLGRDSVSSPARIRAATQRAISRPSGA